MGRPKAYERDEVLARAMEVFWADGYHATSTRDLAAAMGINVATIYAEFQSKEGLYAAALDLYEREVVTAFFGPLDESDASIATVRSTLRQFPAMARRVEVAPGCLVTNAAIERAPDAGVSRDTMSRYVDRVTTGISHAMTNTQMSHRVDPREVRRLSRQLTATLIGLFVMTRSQVRPAVLDDVAASAVAQLDAFARENGIPVTG